VTSSRSRSATLSAAAEFAHARSSFSGRPADPFSSRSLNPPATAFVPGSNAEAARLTRASSGPPPEWPALSRKLGIATLAGGHWVRSLNQRRARERGSITSSGSFPWRKYFSVAQPYIVRRCRGSSSVHSASTERETDDGHKEFCTAQGWQIGQAGARRRLLN
jgi:hypothetical protein